MGMVAASVPAEVGVVHPERGERIEEGDAAEEGGVMLVGKYEASGMEG